MLLVPRLPPSKSEKVIPGSSPGSRLGRACFRPVVLAQGEIVYSGGNLPGEATEPCCGSPKKSPFREKNPFYTLITPGSAHRT